ncbi:hypothetical protein DERF_009840 [Dermatophagoides farinae]|uniref:Uncharacterized protein n=1 Tax=Dermatophagoides farinae TaxID=6954 RepID=A0A922L1X6_DERFA|nr:hypothetical protein DERF_009840 [Dermatophagoides farinae]
MIIGGQIPGSTMEQNLTSEARDGFAMVPEECLSSKTSRAKRVTVLRCPADVLHNTKDYRKTYNALTHNCNSLDVGIRRTIHTSNMSGDGLAARTDDLKICRDLYTFDKSIPYTVRNALISVIEVEKEF